MPIETGGPYLGMAVLCEKVLTEKDGVLSAIRIVDRIMITPGSGAPEIMPAVPVQLKALIMFKAGIAQGSYELKLTVTNPSGEEKHVATLPVLFEGADRGVNLDLNLNFLANEQGLYWFGVYLQGELSTRIPLRIIYQRFGFGAEPAN